MFNKRNNHTGNLPAFRTRFFIAVTLLSCLVCPLLLKGQNLMPGLSFERLSTDMIRYEKGLSQNTVQCIIQDQYGFMWFGTWDGLNKFDGYSFSVWNEENGLSNQNIHALLEDSDGLIWIGTEDGLNVYNREKDQITIYRNDHRNKNSLVHNRIRTLTMDQNGNIWIGTNRGISVFNRKEKKFINYKHDVSDSKSLINNWINHIICDRQGRIWVATFKGLELFDYQKKCFIHHNRSTGWNDIAMLPVYVLAEHPDGSIWMGTEKGVFSIYHEQKRLQTEEIYPEEDLDFDVDQVYHLLFDKRGYLWIGTANRGVILHHLSDKKSVSVRSIKDDPQSISNDQIYSLFMDQNGIIWIGTYSGLNKYDRHSSKFRHHRQKTNDPNGLLSDVIFAFLEDQKGTIWVGSENGINIFNPADGTFDLPLTKTGKPTPLVSALVRSIIQDRDGYIWIGSMGGLSRYHPEKREIKHYKSEDNNKNSLINNSVWVIEEDKDGILWIGTSKGLSRFDKKSEKFLNFIHSPSNVYSLPDNAIYDIYVARNGKIWLATGLGLCWLDPVHFKFYPAFNDMRKILTSNQLRTSGIYEDQNGLMWIGTMGGGVMRFNPVTGRYKFYTEKDGLPNNVAYKVVDDHKGSLWIPTNRGLSRFNITNESFTNYGIKDGVQSNEFNLGASLRTSKGRLLFGGMNGFNSFFPDDIGRNLNPARIAISSFHIFDRLVYRELFHGDTIYLKYSENFFAFEFTALDYANPAKNQYKYYLENFEKGWSMADAYNRTAEYTNVPPGKYQFRVKGSNNDGIWNDEGIAITVIIVPPWYGTIFFRIGFVTVLILTVYLIIKGRLRRINKKHAVEKQFLEIEKQYSNLEQKALRLQMNPHFIFNTLNSIQSYMISNDLDTAIDYLAKFARLMRQVLANSLESYISVKEELVALGYYLEMEEMRFDDKFSFSIHVDQTIDQEFTGIPPMVIQPYVENAIIHGLIHKKDKGKVEIRLTQGQGCIFCVIEDDGVGRAEAGRKSRESGLERKSTGMMITQQRLDILNKNDEQEFKVNVIDKMDETGIPCGTRVEINLPFIEF